MLHSGFGHHCSVGPLAACHTGLLMDGGVRLLFLTFIDDTVANWAALIRNIPLQKEPWMNIRVRSKEMHFSPMAPLNEGFSNAPSKLICYFCSAFKTEDGNLHATSSLESIFYELSSLAVQYCKSLFLIMSTMGWR